MEMERDRIAQLEEQLAQAERDSAYAQADLLAAMTRAAFVRGQLAMLRELARPRYSESSADAPTPTDAR